MQKVPEEILELLKCNLPVSYMFILLLIFNLNAGRFVEENWRAKGSTL